MKYLARFIMWLAGWKYKGELPAEKKAVIISVPHTSNWDFFWGELLFCRNRGSSDAALLQIARLLSLEPSLTKIASNSDIVCAFRHWMTRGR